MTLREKAAQLMFPRIGSNMPPPVTVAEDQERVEALLDRCPVGGLMLFNGAWPETRDVLVRLQQRSRHPLLVATDMERGVGQQIAGATVFPHAMAYMALGDAGPAQLETSARASAREALACGIHITFSPVADVDSNPQNPIIATRAYGTKPEPVAGLVEAYVRGCRAEGLLSTAKHFPGHGDTATDSHAELPVVDRDRAALEATELAPFRAAVSAGVDLVMTAHVSYPALDPSNVPATLSRPILHDLLREDLGFEGAVVTDSLLMGAISETHPDAGAQAVALLRAGVDILLDVRDPEAAVEGIVRAVESGELPAARLDEAFRRVWALKERLLDRHGPDLFTEPEAAVGADVVGAEAHRRLARGVARGAIAVVHGDRRLLPLATEVGGGLLAVLVRPHRSRLDPPEPPMAAAVRAAYPDARFVEVGPETDEAALEALRAEAERAEHVVLAVVVKPAAWHAFGLPAVQQRFVEAVSAARPVVLASLGSPHVLEAFPEAALRLCAYSDVAVSQEALVEALAGRL